jgi:6-pyruvoyltetrahydropterin/6-carboxytetrahydropterin synthase
MMDPAITRVPVLQSPALGASTNTDPGKPTAHFEVSQRFYFEAAHTLQRTIGAEGSRRIHGHTYDAEVTVAGTPEKNTGMVIDLADLRAEISRVRNLLDHHFLDDVPGLGPATLENLCQFIRSQLLDAVPGLCVVTVERKASGDRCRCSW